MTLGMHRTLEKTYPAVFSCSLIILSLLVTQVHAASSVGSSNSSLNCENNDSLFSSSFSCSLNTTVGSAIIVFFGCLSGPSANCNSASVADSQNNTYHYADSVETSCAGETCEEYAFWGTASSTGIDTMTFKTAGSGYLGSDVYDVSGVNTTGIMTSFGGSSANYTPGTFMKLTPSPNSFVAAGVIANDAPQFTAGLGFTLIPGQPCYQCGTKGGWQGSEYQIWGKNGSTYSIFGYSQSNDGWAELALSLAPNISNTTVTCTPQPATVTIASKCSARVTGESPTGTISWTTNSTGTFSPTSCILSSGACSVSYTPTVPESPELITASYGGDSNNPGSAGNFSLSVVKVISKTNVTCSPSPVTTGSSTICTASVSGGSPTGTITWASSGVANFSPADTCTLAGGSCAVDYTSATTGLVKIDAIYSGDANNGGSTGNFSISVNIATSTSSTVSIISTSSSVSLPSSSTTSHATINTLSTSSVSSVSSIQSSSKGRSVPSASITSSSSSEPSSSAGGSSSISWSFLVIVAIIIALFLGVGFVAMRRKGHRTQP